MKLKSSNATISNSVVASKVSMGSSNNFFNANGEFVAPGVFAVSANTLVINSSSISAGNLTINTSIISTPLLSINSKNFTGNLFGGIISYQQFDANGTWYNPLANSSVNSYMSGYEQVLVMAWGGGGGASSNNSATRGGGGGACAVTNYSLRDLPNTVSVTVGSGGTLARTTATALATAGNGGNSIFHTVTAYGGGGGRSTGGGGGGGSFATTLATSGGYPLPGAAGNPGGVSTYGGGGGCSVAGSNGGASVFGGGGGGGGATTGRGGNSFFGGGGGNGVGSPGVSILGGNGGASGTAGSVPGGGGGCNTSSSSAGARGEVRVWVLGPAGVTVGPPTYSLSADTISLYEGYSAVYTVSTAGVADGTVLYYTLNNSSAAVSSDFSTAVNGSVLISGGVGTFTLTAADDADTTDENFQIDIRRESTTGPIVASNNSVSIVATSPAVVSYGSTITGTASGSAVFNANNMSIGSANSTRTVIVAVFNNDSRSTAPSSVTINGTISADQVATITNAGGAVLQFWTALVPDGTTANVAVQTNGTVDSFGVSTFYANSMLSRTPAYIKTSTAAPATNNIVIPTDGFGVTISMSGEAAGTPTATWTGMTESFDAQRSAGTSTTFSGAITNTANTTGETVTCTWTGTTTGGRAFLSASWR